MAAKSKIAQHVTLAEEKAAVQLEQKRESKPISPARLKDVQRVHEIKALMRPYEAEIDEIKARVYKEMDNKGVDVLTRKGVEIVSRDRVEGEAWDRESIKKKFPEVVIEFVVEKISYRINWKNPFSL